MRAPQHKKKASQIQGLKEMGGGSLFSQRMKEPPQCGCGVEAPLLTSWTGRNPGKLFCGYGRFKVEIRFIL